MKYIFSILGIILSFLIIKYREDLGNTMGGAKWMTYVGGPYIVMVIIGVIIFFWSFATLTGTEELLFSTFIWIIPGLSTQEPPPPPNTF